MQRKSVCIDTHKISYLEANPGNGKLIFFLHGNSGSARLWTHQLSDSGLASYHLIAFDMPGHGGSGKTDGYNVIQMAGLLRRAVLELSGPRPFALIGLSLGTNIIGEMFGSPMFPAGIGLVSATLVGQGIQPADVVKAGASATALYEDRPDERLVNALLEEAVHADNPDAKALIREDYNAADPLFRSSLKAGIAAGLYSDEIALLKTYAACPMLCLYGAEDKITNPGLLDEIDFPYWKGTIFKLPATGHLPPLEQPSLFSEYLRDFARAIFYR